MQLFVPREKHKKFRSACRRMLKKSCGRATKLRTFASLAGKLQNLAPAVPFCWLHLQAVVQTIRENGRKTFWRGPVGRFSKNTNSSSGGTRVVELVSKRVEWKCNHSGTDQHRPIPTPPTQGKGVS